MTYALAGIARVLPELLAAYRTGAGVPFASYGDEGSIRRATRNAVQAGVDDRVSFAVQDAADPRLAGRYDAAMLFEALHDLARPVEALAAARALLVDGGCLLVGDERVAERASPRRATRWSG